MCPLATQSRKLCWASLKNIVTFRPWMLLRTKPKNSREIAGKKNFEKKKINKVIEVSVMAHNHQNVRMMQFRGNTRATMATDNEMSLLLFLNRQFFCVIISSDVKQCSSDYSTPSWSIKSLEFRLHIAVSRSNKAAANPLEYTPRDLAQEPPFTAEISFSYLLILTLKLESLIRLRINLRRQYSLYR